MEEDEDPIAGGKTGFLINNKTKQTKAGLDTRRTTMTYGSR